MIKIVLILTSFIWATSAVAMDISWMYIQHRIYENDGTRNRLSFSLIDGSGHIVTADKSIKSVELLDPKGRRIELNNYSFNQDEEIYGVYDGMRSQWHFIPEWQRDSWFSANFSEPLIPGIYRLKVITNKDKITEFPYNFKNVAALPVITSRSFRIHPDTYGNLIWKWEVPDTLGHIAYNIETTTRASIDIYQNNKQAAYFFVKVPSHMGYVFIPRNIVQTISAKGGRFGLRVQIETRDNNTRTYSDTLMVDSLLVTVPQAESYSDPLK